MQAGLVQLFCGRLQSKTLRNAEGLHGDSYYFICSPGEQANVASAPKRIRKHGRNIGTGFPDPARMKRSLKRSFIAPEESVYTRGHELRIL